MRLLDRYLLRELLIPLGYCLCGFLIFYIAFDLVSQLHVYQENMMTVAEVAELYVVRMPEMLVFILPIVLLLSLLYTLTNHARHHELTAIRAAGVGLQRICAPYLAVGLLLSFGVFAMNEYLAPDSAMKEKQIMNRHKDAAVPANAKALSDLNFINSRDGRVWHGRIDLKSPQLTMTDARVFFSEQGTNFWLFANSGERLHDTWTFYDVQMYAVTNVAAQLVPMFSTNVLEMKQFSETPDEIRREVKFAERLNQPSSDISEIPVAEILDYLDLHPHDLPDQKRRSLYTQLHGRLASPWTSLVVVLIAIPFGAASGRRNIFVGVAGSIVICFVYFVLLKLGLAMGTGGYLPPWLAAWLPNITFGIAGFWLMLRVR